MFLYLDESKERQRATLNIGKRLSKRLSSPLVTRQMKRRGFDTHTKKNFQKILQLAE